MATLKEQHRDELVRALAAAVDTLARAERGAGLWADDISATVEQQLGVGPSDPQRFSDPEYERNLRLLSKIREARARRRNPGAMTTPVVRWEDLEDRAGHWWVSHGVPGEDDYACSMPTSSMDERERGLYETCGCRFADGNTITPRQVRIWTDGTSWRLRRGNAPTAATGAVGRSGRTARESASAAA